MEYPRYEEIKQAREHLKDLSFSHWVHDDFLTFNWWMLLAVSIFPWILWFKYRDKTRTYEILTYGFLWSTVATTLDSAGSDLTLWGYPDKLIPSAPPLLPADLAVIPVTFMFVYQIVRSSIPYMLCTLMVSALFAYILEPLTIKADIFVMHTWSHTWSFIGFFLISLFIKWAMVKLNSNA